MKAVVATVAGLFAAGAVAVPSAQHHHHEHLHRRHAQPEAEPQTDISYVYQTATQTTVQYVDANGNPVQQATPAPAPPAPAPEHHHHEQAQGNQGTFATVVTANNGEQVTAQAWGWNGPNGEHGYSWVYTEPGSQPTEAPAPSSYQAPAPSSYQAPAPAPSSEAPAPAPASSSQPAAASSASAPSNPGSNQFQQSIVQAHNVHRANHSVPALSWHDGLASAAQAVANMCNWQHNTQVNVDTCGFPQGYGQNYACSSGSDNPADDVTGEWYGEEGIYELSGSYGQANPNPYQVNGQDVETGHFTQVVWKSTTHVGCAVANCPGGVSGINSDPPMTSFFVCDYGPPGNYGGEYADNVPRPKGEPTTTGDSAPAGY